MAALALRKNVSPIYRSQAHTGDPYLDIFAAMVRRAIQDVAVGNGHAKEAARFLREHELARSVMELAGEVGIEIDVGGE